MMTSDDYNMLKSDVIDFMVTKIKANAKLFNENALLNNLLHLQHQGRHRVQLVRRVAQEPLVRGSNPSGARVQWNEGC